MDLIIPSAKDGLSFEKKVKILRRQDSKMLRLDSSSNLELRRTKDSIHVLCSISEAVYVLKKMLRF